jgi:hypothetical protein
MNIHDFAQTLCTELTFPEVKGIEREQDMLLGMNADLGNPPHGFILGGSFITNLPTNMHKNLTKKPVHNSLLIPALNFLERRKQLDKDQRMLSQGLLSLLKPCKTLQDVRDALPNTLKQFLPEIQPLPRTREEAWTMQSSPMLKRQWEKTEDLITLFLANRML